MEEREDGWVEKERVLPLFHPPFQSSIHPPRSAAHRRGVDQRTEDPAVRGQTPADGFLTRSRDGGTLAAAMRHLLWAIWAAAASAALAGGPSPPKQPASGPGGTDYAHAKVTTRQYGSGVEQYWILEPAEPAPKAAPLIVFNHGWMGMRPVVYLGWLHHLARRGNIVVFPRYQLGPTTRPWTFARNAIAAVKAALEELQRPGHVRPQLDRFAIAGHSAGGAITADMAALAAEKGLPTPKAIMVVQPGRGLRRAHTPLFPAADYKKIPKDTLMLVVVGSDDRIVGDVAALDLFRRTPQIPADRKDYIIMHSDRHGHPPLIADHESPCSPILPHVVLTGRRINALDTHGYWKLFDALTDFAFHGTHKAYALGATPEQRSMGQWSDGTPVKPLTVTDEP